MSGSKKAPIDTATVLRRDVVALLEERKALWTRMAKRLERETQSEFVRLQSNRCDARLTELDELLVFVRGN